MTTKNEWKKFNGSREQIAEMIHSKNGYVLKNGNHQSDKKTQGFALNGKFQCKDDDYGEYWPIEEYWIIPDDPLREMKIRQADTGQPVYVKTPSKRAKDKFSYYKTTNPNWSEIGAEYSFTAFEE